MLGLGRRRGRGTMYSPAMFISPFEQMSSINLYLATGMAGCCYQKVGGIGMMDIKHTQTHTHILYMHACREAGKHKNPSVLPLYPYYTQVISLTLSLKNKVYTLMFQGNPLRKENIVQDLNEVYIQACIQLGLGRKMIIIIFLQKDSGFFVKCQENKHVQCFTSTLTSSILNPVNNLLLTLIKCEECICRKLKRIGHALVANILLHSVVVQQCRYCMVNKFFKQKQILQACSLIMFSNHADIQLHLNSISF